MKTSAWVLTAFLLIIIPFCGSNAQTVYYVNAATGSNSSGTGAIGAPFKTITKALSVSAASGDSIKVAPGTYNLALGEVFPIEMLTGRKLIGTGGAAVTIVSAAASGNRVFNCNANSSSTIIQGFTITGGYALDSSSGGATSKGGGLYISGGSQLIIQQNIITANTARGYDFYQAGVGALNGGTAYGGGIYIASSSPVIRNNVITHNIANGGGGKDFRGGWSGNGSAGGNAYGGGIHAAFGGASVIINNTFYGNEAHGGLGGSSNSLNAGDGGNAAAGALDAGSSAIVTNNIFSNNTSVAGTVGGGANGSNGSSADGALTSFTAGNCSNNLYYSNTASVNPNGGIVGANAITADPLFISSTNYHLQAASPAKKAGTAAGAPLTDFDGNMRTNPPSIGAFDGSGVVSIRRSDIDLPTECTLDQNFPNPFNPATTISYHLAAAGMTTVSVFDALGRETATLVNEMKDAGSYTVSFNASHLSSGVYVVRLVSGKSVQTRHMVLIK